MSTVREEATVRDFIEGCVKNLFRRGRAHPLKKKPDDYRKNPKVLASAPGTACQHKAHERSGSPVCALYVKEQT